MVTAEGKTFREKFGPRGVIHSWAQADGTQKIEDTGPMTRKRMETADDEFTDAAIDFIDRAHKAKKPFFVWYNATRMHVWTRLSDKWYRKSGISIYADGMLYGYLENGKVVLVDPDPESFAVRSSFEITRGEGNHWSHPVVSHGVLYVRHGSALMAFDLKAGAAAAAATAAGAP